MFVIKMFNVKIKDLHNREKIISSVWFVRDFTNNHKLISDVTVGIFDLQKEKIIEYEELFTKDIANFPDAFLDKFNRAFFKIVKEIRKSDRFKNAAKSIFKKDNPEMNLDSALEEWQKNINEHTTEMSSFFSKRRKHGKRYYIQRKVLILATQKESWRIWKER